MNGARDETIRDVSRTMRDLLKAKLPDIGAQIDLAAPQNAGANVLTLFLYKILENPYLKNEDRIVQAPERNGDGELSEQSSPLTVDLYYLLTAHSSDPPDPLEAHRALSRAMRVFYDNGIIRGSLLRAEDPSTGLTEDSVLRVTLNPITMEDMTRIWSVFPDTPYEISVSYLVTPVPIESRRTVPSAPVVDQIHQHGQSEAALVREET